MKTYKRRRTYRRRKNNTDYCTKWFRAVLPVTVNAANDIQSVYEHAQTLGNLNSYITYRGLYRKAKILSAKCAYYPGFATINNTTSANYMQPIALAPVYGDVNNIAINYVSIVGNPACRFINAYNPDVKYVKWTLPRDPELEWYDTNGVNILGDTWGGFALFSDGAGFASGTRVGDVVLTFKVAFKESTIG